MPSDLLFTLGTLQIREFLRFALRSENSKGMSKTTSKTVKRAAPGRPDRGDSTDRRTLILNAAVRLYARHGFENVTLKDVAQDTGVATNLIRHHFGSKDDFRNACRVHAMQEIKQHLSGLISATEEHAAEREDLDRIGRALADGVGHRIDLFRYLAKEISLGGEASNQMFDDYYSIVDTLTNRFSNANLLDAELDELWITFYFIFIQIGTVFLLDQVERRSGKDAYDPEVSARRSATLLRITQKGIFEQMSVCRKR
jgi:AcrR family transcriptional regulator